MSFICSCGGEYSRQSCMTGKLEITTIQCKDKVSVGRYGSSYTRV